MFEFNILAIVIAIVVSIITTCLLNMRKKRPKIIMLQNDKNEWLELEKCPIPDFMFHQELLGYLAREILISDGKRVSATQNVRYNAKGEMVCGYSVEQPVKYWRPLPKPPDVQNET